ncbi:hypothetical protein CVT26_007670 [Gymnopilus dilepis]|uniref:Uncharacterized protein n=1 Tax=Gymnopilus dilepis TaxID=231916 RepID=A0A409W836_9AGAR|nr:hypothetical protein CVT26_007670 [Gymnopilus dilepis]
MSCRERVRKRGWKVGDKIQVVAWAEGSDLRRPSDLAGMKDAVAVGHRQQPEPATRDEEGTHHPLRAAPPTEKP